MSGVKGDPYLAVLEASSVLRYTNKNAQGSFMGYWVSKPRGPNARSLTHYVMPLIPSNLIFFITHIYPNKRYSKGQNANTSIEHLSCMWSTQV